MVIKLIGAFLAEIGFGILFNIQMCIRDSGSAVA